MDLKQKKIEYLKKVNPRIEQIDRFMSKEYFKGIEANNYGWTSDPNFGFVHKNAIRHDGVDHSLTYYHYDKSGSRISPNYPSHEARISSYGNSYTHCDQVNDEETWQEYLGGFIGERIKNYGVGGYSVYQAYLRMLKTQKAHPTKYIIFNIYCDDHFRNLDSIRSRIRMHVDAPAGFPIPHLKVNLEKGTCTPVENRYKTMEDLRKLTDESFFIKTYLEDPLLDMLIRLKEQKEVERADPSLGFPVFRYDSDKALKAYREKAFLATDQVLRWIEEYIERENKSLILVLSYPITDVRNDILGKPSWDQKFLDKLKDKPYPVINLREEHVKDFDKYSIGVEEYLKMFFNGHYSPKGNFFAAECLRNCVIEHLDPSPRIIHNKAF